MTRRAGVYGAEKVSAMLKRWPRTTFAAMDTALDKSAAEIATLARFLVTSEEVRGAIEVRGSLNGFKGRRAVGAFARASGLEGAQLTRFIGVFPDSRQSPGWWAAFLEYGTAPGPRRIRRGPRSGTSFNHPGTDPAPFLRPAFRSLERRAVTRLRLATSAAAKSVAQGRAGV